MTQKTAKNELLTKAWTNENADRLLTLFENLVQARAILLPEELLDLEARLRPFVKESARTLVCFRHGRSEGNLLRAYEHLLVLLAKQNVEGAEKLIIAARKKQPELAAKAAEAQAILRGVPDPQEFISALVEKVGIEGLTQIQRSFFGASTLYWGDLEQLLLMGGMCDDEDFDSDEDMDAHMAEDEAYLDMIAEGLRAIGAQRTAKVFEKVRKGAEIEVLETMLSESKVENILAMLFDFAREHPDEFRPNASRKKRG